MKPKKPTSSPFDRLVHSELHGCNIWHDRNPGKISWHVTHPGVTDGEQPCRSYRTLEEAREGIEAAHEDALNGDPKELADYNPAYLYRMSVLFADAAENLRAAFDLVGKACIDSADDSTWIAVPNVPTREALMTTKINVKKLLRDALACMEVGVSLDQSRTLCTQLYACLYTIAVQTGHLPTSKRASGPRGKSASPRGRGKPQKARL